LSWYARFSLPRADLKPFSTERTSLRRVIVAFLSWAIMSRPVLSRVAFKFWRSEWISLRRYFVALLICVASSPRCRRLVAIADATRAIPSDTFAMINLPSKPSAE
jgi:hypothetical protein